MQPIFRKLRRFLIPVLALMPIAVGAATPEPLPGPLLQGLGSLQHPVTTRSDLAQQYFDQGLRLLYAFNHREAARAFRSAAHLDPDCAMAHWGVAYAHGPHVNRPMDPDDTAAAWAALQAARAKAAGVSGREQAYIRTLGARYQEQHVEDRSDLDRAFAGAMRELTRDYPDDLDARVLFAESLMNTIPWDYWTRDRTPRPETDEILAALRLVIARQPDHPGANHFYIHAVEAGPNPEWGLPAADRLAGYAPAAGHLVHMPAHIYMRVGQYADAVRSNQLAVQADRDYFRQCQSMGFYPGAYYPHNLHFQWWAEVFEGRRASAIRLANEVAQLARDNVCGPNKALEAPRLRHLPWLTLARFGDWDAVLAVARPPATNDFLVDRALWHFTRGLAHAALGDPNAAAREHQELGRLASSDAARELTTPAFPVADTLAVAEAWLAGRSAMAAGDTASGLDHLRRAVVAEDAIAYMEPTFWPLPVRPALGAALLRAGDASAAEAVFREDLHRWPRNGWALFGLEQSLQAQGNNESAALVKRERLTAWERADVTPQLEWY
ncbi:MAG: hypothetical protein KF791_10655 [Verrucomicrobiae bacterium]|nr:hypothetical protein [Verrucomicrobiae bacterium]